MLLNQSADSVVWTSQVTTSVIAHFQLLLLGNSHTRVLKKVSTSAVYHQGHSSDFRNTEVRGPTVQHAFFVFNYLDFSIYLSKLGFNGGMMVIKLS